ncbi:MAG: winged helix-turn-helix transcriptional regulator [Afipia sp.]|nr:winged helix-turn-helix transcriptional regulator [Afipia sp.]
MSTDSSEDERIVLNLLNSVEVGATSQRHIAAELGIALGLVNAYLKRCVNKGLVKVNQVPARRYAYYLTPSGFAEKSRLTVEYLSSSFSFFRQARSDCSDLFALAKAKNFQNLVLAGKSDLAEIAIISAVESGVTIVAVVDKDTDGSPFVGRSVVKDFDALAMPVDAVVITDLRNARTAFDAAVARYGADRVLAPKLLGLSAVVVQENLQ